MCFAAAFVVVPEARLRLNVFGHLRDKMCFVTTCVVVPEARLLLNVCGHLRDPEAKYCTRLRMREIKRPIRVVI